MWKWRRTGEGDVAVLAAREEAEDAGPAGGPVPCPVDEDAAAVDQFVAVLRALGQHAFDLEHVSAISFQQQCEAWSRHLLLGTPAPIQAVDDGRGDDGRGDDGRGDDGLADAADSTGRCDGGERLPPDWAGVQRFLLQHRRREQEYVATSLGDLRQGIWAFAQTLGTALVEDHRSDTRVVGQIARLKRAAEELSTEELKREVQEAAASISTLVSERQRRQQARLQDLGARVSDLAGQLREAKRENVRDGLTQLVNRKGFDDFLSRVVFLRDVFGEQACMLMVDVDHFKKINDGYGHPAGDAVLKALADCLVRNFPRKSDLVARYGGEEFAIVLPDTSLQNGHRLAERLLGAIAELAVEHGGRSLKATVSIGVSQLARFETAQGWLERTDQALYRAKAGGRNRVVDAAEPDPFE